MFSLKWGRKYGKKYHRFKSLAQWRQNVSSFAYQLCDLENNLVKYPFFNMQKQTLQYLLVFLLSIYLCVCVCIFPSSSWYRLNYNSVSPHKMLSSFSSNFQLCWWEKKINYFLKFFNDTSYWPGRVLLSIFIFFLFSSSSQMRIIQVSVYSHSHNILYNIYWIPDSFLSLLHH